MNVYEGLDTYKTYVAIRNHFKQDSYDFIKYNGKCNVNADTFLKRRDKFFFAKLERKLPKAERVYFFVSNFIKDENNWSGSLVTEQSMSIYNEWKKRIESLTYLFKEDCNNLKLIIDSSEKSFNNLFESDGSHPALLKLYMRDEVSLETMVIIDKVLNYTRIWDKQLKDDIVWQNIRRMITKYASFVNVDTHKYKAIMKQTFL